MSVKILVVGDPHITPGELADGDGLIRCIENTAAECKPDAIVLTGDCYHTHSLVNLLVVDFWKRAIRTLAPLSDITIWLRGNHELADAKGSPIHALQVHDGDPVLLVTEPMVWNGFLLMPYYPSGEEFVVDCNKYPHIKKMICHQSFAGAEFENGFYDPTGIDQNLVPQIDIVSGHIHKPAQLGKVTYVGAPRWRSIADANTERHLHLIEYDGDKRISTKLYPTKGYCRPIYVLEDRPGSPVQIPAGNARVHIDIYGPPDYVKTRKGELDGNGYRIRSFPDKQSISKVRESEGISVALQKYISTYDAKHGTTKDQLQAIAQERVSWLRLK